jgi:class 3 adenylate cyclase
MMATAQPSGTVTLVFTDIEGSTRLLHDLGQEPYRQALRRDAERSTGTALPAFAGRLWQLAASKCASDALSASERDCFSCA